MTLPAKLGVGALTLGSATAAGCGVIIYSKKETTISQLIKDKFEYISLKTEGDSDDAYWKENWNSYRAEGNNVFGLSGWVQGQIDLNLTPALKTKCNSLSKSTDNNIYENFSKYCSRAVTIADEAKNDGLSIIKDDDTSEDEKAWKTKKESKQKLTVHFNKLSIPVGEDVTSVQIREKCKLAKDKKKQVTDYAEIYTSYKTVCTNSK